MPETTMTIRHSYYVGAVGKQFRSHSSRKAAEVACNWKRRGLKPLAQTILTAPEVRLANVPITTVGRTTKAFVAAGHRLTMNMRR